MPSTDRTYHTERTALIDADYLAYHTAAAAHSHQMDQLEMHEKMMTELEQWMTAACAPKAILVFSCSRDDNFRRDHYPLYKTNRTATPPALLGEAHKLLQNSRFPTLSRPRIEADDVIGILMTNGAITNPVCISRDKDLRQIPGWHLNPYVEDFPVRVTNDEADRLFYQQWLTGDSTDGFGGIKGMGPKRAVGLLEGLQPHEWEKACCEAYFNAGMTWDEAMAQARCARILRAGDWDPYGKAPRPWTASERLQWADEELTCARN